MINNHWLWLCNAIRNAHGIKLNHHYQLLPSEQGLGLGHSFRKTRWSLILCLKWLAVRGTTTTTPTRTMTKTRRRNHFIDFPFFSLGTDSMSLKKGSPLLHLSCCFWTDFLFREQLNIFKSGNKNCSVSQLSSRTAGITIKTENSGRQDFIWPIYKSTFVWSTRYQS